MNLDEYLTKERYGENYSLELTVRAFAKKLGVTQIYLSAVRTGRQKMSKKLADDIEKASGGKVNAEESMKQIAWKKRHGIPMEDK